jgi:SAM-dependent methyltransferase
MTHKYPVFFARFYDTIYHGMRDSVDNEYFQKEISSVNGKILETGVGTGRLFMNALHNKADIYGIDISEAMLDILYGKLPEEQHYRVTKQNIVDFSLDTRFDLVIAPFRVFMHLLDKNDQLRALNNVHAHLNHGGRFIFDVFVPDLSLLQNGIRARVDFEGEYAPGHRLKRVVDSIPDLTNQKLDITFYIEWEEEGKVLSDKWSLPLRFFFRYELEHLIERSDFGSYKIYGDYAGNELGSNSKEFLIVCYK